MRRISAPSQWGSRLWVDPAVQTAHPAFVVAPQRDLNVFKPCGMVWVIQSLDADYDYSKNVIVPRMPTGQWRAVIGLIHELESRHPVDPGRIYLVGQGEDAWGVWAMLETHPELPAAAIVVTGAGDGDGIAPGRWPSPLHGISGTRTRSALLVARVHPGA